MTAPTKTLRTPAEADLIDRFAKIRSALPGTAEVARVRERAFAAFERQGLPDRRVETWKYSDLRARLKEAVPLAGRLPDKESAAAFAKAKDTFGSLDCFRLVLVNGYLDVELSDRDALLNEGVEVATLSELLGGDGAAAADLLAVPEIASDDIAVALNAAFVADGAVVLVAENARPQKPIEILSIVTDAAPVAVHSRHRIVVGAGASATFIESSTGGCDSSEINLLTEYRVGEKARLTVARLQATDVGATHVASNLISVDKIAEVKHLSAEAGAGFSRNQTFVTFAGEDAEAEILGLAMLNDRRHIDHTLVIDHAVPNCRSIETFKTVVDDHATGAFQGKIVVRPDAQKTNAKMMSQALLLAEEAEMAAKPELEIFADDVVCGHGATSGRIDAEMLFYLMARGVPRADAERLLIEAFLADPVDAIGNDAIADAIKETVSAWLGARNSSREEVLS